MLRGIRLIGVDATLPWNVPGYPGDVATWRRDREKRLEIWRRLDELKLHQAQCVCVCVPGGFRSACPSTGVVRVVGFRGGSTQPSK